MQPASNKRRLALRVGEVMFAREFVWHLRAIRGGKAHFDVWRIDDEPIWQEHDVPKILKRSPDYAGTLQQIKAQAGGDVKAVSVSRRAG